MATFAVPDRSGPNLDLLANAVVDGSPVYPFHYTPVEGFVAMDPAVTYVGSVVRSEAVLKNIPNTEVVLAVCEAYKIMITNKKLYHFGTTWAAGSNDTQAFSPVPTYNEQMTYVMRIEATDANNLLVKIFSSSGTLVTSATLTVTTLFGGDPTFHLGYLTDSQIANDDGLAPGYDVTLIRMQAENPGPTAVVLTPFASTTTADVGYWIGRLVATHARTENMPCTFKITGGTNAALFSIKGSNFYVADTLTAGVKVAQVTATDRFGATVANNVYVTVGTMAAPTNIALVNASFETDGETTEIGGFTVTDADTGDVHTMTLVTGTGSTDNALFEIVGGTTLHLVDPDQVAKVCAIRVRATDVAGLYYEKALTMTITNP